MYRNISDSPWSDVVVCEQHCFTQERTHSHFVYIMYISAPVTPIRRAPKTTITIIVQLGTPPLECLVFATETLVFWGIIMMVPLVTTASVTGSVTCSVPTGSVGVPQECV